MLITKELTAAMTANNNAMASNVMGTTSAQGPNCFKEAVCIDTKRIYDSCSEQHCAG